MYCAASLIPGLQALLPLLVEQSQICGLNAVRYLGQCLVRYLWQLDQDAHSGRLTRLYARDTRFFSPRICVPRGMFSIKRYPLNLVLII